MADHVWLLAVIACLFYSSISLVNGVSTDYKAQFDGIYDLWDAVVSKHVSPGELEGVQLNVVDYSGISNDTNFDAYLAAIAKANTTGLSRNETYAFFINVYNALAIKMIIKHPCKTGLFSSCQPISSIKDIGSSLKPVWGMPAGIVGGKEYTLDEVEGYLRNPTPYTEDSRLHACIVCASISCPNVRTSAFRPETIDKQMDSQVKDFLSNPKKGYILNKATNTAQLSPIFLWFSADFARYGGVQKFILPYLSAEDASYMTDHSVSMSYFTYDWNANGKPPCHC